MNCPDILSFFLLGNKVLAEIVNTHSKRLDWDVPFRIPSTATRRQLLVGGEKEGQNEKWALSPFTIINVTCCFNWSGREDLNLRPPEPHSGSRDVKNCF
jgi:hypothetical protein